MWIIFRIIRNVQKQLADLEKLCNLSNSRVHFFCIVLQMILICPLSFNLQYSNCVTLFHICFRIFQISPIFFYICLNFLSYLFFSFFFHICVVGGALTISLNPIWPILHSRVKLHQNKHLQLQLDPIEKENIAGKFKLILSSISVIARTQYAVFSCQICIWRACSAYQVIR